MPHTVDELLHLSEEKLGELFGSSPPGEIPDGPSTGTAIIAPGSDVTPGLAKLGALFWQGKIFDSKNGTLLNEIGGHEAIAATVSEGTSLFDGEPCLVLDYSGNSGIVGHIRDEIRKIAAGFYLGKVYWDDQPLIYFCLQFND